ASLGGGLLNSSNNGGTATLTNTIVAGNTASSSGNTFGTIGGTNNLIGGTVLLRPLGTLGSAHGTPNPPPLPGSPAIDAGTATGAPATDQRGIARVGTPDIGAFESQGFSLEGISGSNQSVTNSSPFPNPLVVSVSSSHGEPVDGGQVAFTANAG